MIGKQGLRLGVLLGLLVASAQSGCGRSASETGAPDDRGEAGESTGGRGSDVALPEGGADDVGAGGAALAEGGVGGTGGTSASDLGAGGEAIVVGGAGPEGCEPGERTCDGPSIRVCSPDGHSTIETTCSLSQVCNQGECQAIACVPDSEFCKAGAIRKCSNEGTFSTLSKTCSGGQFCHEQDGVAECSATACVANKPLCLGNVATACKADGSGAKAGGVDCSATARLCDDGQCVDPTCTPGEKLCEHDDVYLCVGGGAKSVLFTECNVDEVCDPALVACRNRICEPGKLGCDSTRVAVCNALGTGWEQSGQDCATSDKSCVDGACQTRICVPSAQYCKNNDVYQCDANGTSASLYSSCSPASYYHCSAYNVSQAYCAYNACVPGAAICNGNLATVCDAMGTGPVAGGTDCGSDSFCDGGVCKPKVCDAYTSFCKGDDVAQCQGGLSYYIASACPDDAPCALTDAGAAACVPYECWPGLKACLGNKVGTCAQDGNSLAVVKQDCGATDEVCVSASSCGQTAVDTVGEADELTSVSEGSFFGDIIAVQSNRALTGLEANIVLAASRDLRWCVFELVDNYYVSRYEKIVKGQSGSGYLSSGVLNYTLKAGKQYLLGVAVSGGGAVPYYDSIPWQPDASLGKVLSSLTSTYSTSLWAYYATSSLVYDLRITTALP
jgi:hypothetical protein